MKNLMISTALVAFSAVAVHAQTASPFRTEAVAGEVYASDFIGMRVYAAEADIDGNVAAGVQDGWDDIGEINDVILSRDGNVDAVLVDIGGFLGMGERQVAVNMNAIKFVSDDGTADNANDFFLVMTAADAMVKEAPEYMRVSNMHNETVIADGSVPAVAAGGVVPPIECDADFSTLDIDGDGYLSEAEAQRAYARSRVDGVTLQEKGISKEEYNALCESPAWAENTPEEGAPFEGANSFTEEQARDRAVAWDVTDVSALTKDDMGIWRGTGTANGAAVSVAVDYKGNVVTSAAKP